MMFKGHKRDMVKIEREKRIARCMKRMPKLIEAYREDVKKRKRKTGLAEILMTPKELSVVDKEKGGKRVKQSRSEQKQQKIRARKR